MTRERRITILVLIGTLIAGILIGMLTPGLVHKYRGVQRGHGGPGRSDEGKKECGERMELPQGYLRSNGGTRKSALGAAFLQKSIGFLDG